MPKKVKKTQRRPVWKNEHWNVFRGQLAKKPGNPGKVRSLFSAIAEKIPFEALDHVKSEMKKIGVSLNGVYLAHDSMGCVRYIGRGHIFHRLQDRWRESRLELRYFSFYVVEDKNHERELETILIRAVSPLLHFNTQKKRCAYAFSRGMQVVRVAAESLARS